MGNTPNPVADAAELQDGANNEGLLVINWGARGWGFGQLTFYTVDGRPGLVCDNEAMSKRFCKTVLEKLIETLPAGEPTPPLIARYATLDAMLDDSNPHHPGPDWPPRKEGEP